MSKIIQIRNVPESLHRRLKSRAALEGMSLSQYLLREISRAAERPSLDNLRRRLARRAPVHTSVTPARAVREQRGAG
jgi:plasmid stability protein